MNSGGELKPAVGSLDEIAEGLAERAARLSRVFRGCTSVRISGLEADVLGALSTRPRRITELAAREAVTQPAITRLVDRLEGRGWVRREPDPADARVVLVTLTDSGHNTLASLRSEYRALMHVEIATLPARDVRTLARAIEILDQLIERLSAEAADTHVHRSEPH